MRSFLDAKAMAKTLRLELKNHKIDLGHSECLEIAARQFGFRDWNTMTGLIQKQPRFLIKPQENTPGLPKGWLKSGIGNDAYRVSTIPLPDDESRSYVSIASLENEKGGREPDPGDFCTVMQVIAAEDFRGKRASFRAELMSEGVSGSVTVWMRVDDINGKSIAFDNREEHVLNGSLKGTNDWVGRNVILDIPSAGETIHFGFYLWGRGRACARKFDFGTTEEVPSSAGIPRPKAPQNLDLKVA
jgi:hypothetical protein